MTSRTKVSMFLFGMLTAMLMIVSAQLMFMTPAIADTSYPIYLKVRSLEIVDDQGKTTAILNTGKGGGYLEVYGKDGKRTLWLGATIDGSGGIAGYKNEKLQWGY